MGRSIENSTPGGENIRHFEGLPTPLSEIPEQYRTIAVLPDGSGVIVDSRKCYELVSKDGYHKMIESVNADRS